MHSCSTSRKLRSLWYSDFFNQSLNRIKTVKPRKIWLYNRANFELANAILESIDWTLVLTGDTINMVWSNWKKIFLSVMETCIPHRKLSKKWNLPWLTSRLKRLMRARDRAYKRAKETNLASHWMTLGYVHICVGVGHSCSNTSNE